MTDRHYSEGIPALMTVIAIAVAGMALSWSCSRGSDQVAAQRVAQAVAERDSARSREVRLRDSARRADAIRTAAWDQYVVELQGQHQAELQAAVQHTTARARRTVEARTGKPWQMAPDTGSGTPPCLVTLTCAEAAVWQASDSLQRASADSTRSWAPVAAAVCSTKVAETRAACESSCADRSRKASTGIGLGGHLLIIVGVSIAAFLAGLMGTR